MGVRLDAGGHPDHDGLGGAELAGDVGEALDLLEGVDDDPPDAGVHRAAQLHGRLVVAVVADPGRVDAGTQRDGQLTVAAHVEAQPLLRDPAGDRGAEEGLAGVVDVVAAERVAEGLRPGAELALVEDERRGVHVGHQVRHRDAADVQHAVVVLARRRRPQRGHQRVDVLGLAQPHRRGAGEAAGRDVPAHIRSGAETPSRSRPLAITVRVATVSTRRASLTGWTGSSPCGSIRHSRVSYHLLNTEAVSSR
ncbi:hypothetical protein L615_001500000590 [Nocardioides sp. J9]|nr:hypothetical protein L615_001500000590 [Nocardioides sp. J9]